MLNEYEIKRKRGFIWLFESIQLVLLTICIYSSFVVMPYVIDQLNSWRPALSEPLVIRVVAADTTKQAEKQKQQIAEKVIQAVENNLEPDLSTAAIQKVVHNELKSIKNIENIPYQLTTKKELIPPKLINGVIYPQHIHKTVLVQTRNGKGDIFFCAVFPNVCMKEDKEQKDEKEKIKFKWFDKIFRK